MEGKYFFNGKDITMNMCIQIRDVIDIIQATTGLNFPDATLAFYESIPSRSYWAALFSNIQKVIFYLKNSHARQPYCGICLICRCIPIANNT